MLLFIIIIIIIIIKKNFKSTKMYLSLSRDRQKPWMTGFKPITTALPVPSSPPDKACLLFTSLAILPAAPVSWGGASCRRKCGRKRRLNLFEPQFLWHLPFLSLAKLKQNNQVKMSDQIYRCYTILLRAVLCNKFKIICRTLQAWKEGQWKNRFRDNNNNNIALSPRRCK